MQHGTKTLSLTINQRNLYMYFLAHCKNNQNTPCFVPKLPVQGNSKADYIRCIKACEEKGLFIVDRSADNYTGWIMMPVTT